jgi:hypothetical protein
MCHRHHTADVLHPTAPLCGAHKAAGARGTQSKPLSSWGNPQLVFHGKSIYKWMRFWGTSILGNPEKGNKLWSMESMAKRFSVHGPHGTSLKLSRKHHVVLPGWMAKDESSRKFQDVDDVSNVWLVQFDPVNK